MYREHLILDHAPTPDVDIYETPLSPCSPLSLEQCLIEIEKLWQFSPVEQACALFRSANFGVWETEYFDPGSSKSVSIDLKAIIRRIGEDESDAIILSHYHPQGTTRPSKADLRTTRSIAQICKALNVTLVDHIIFGTQPYFSFRQANLL